MSPRVRRATMASMRPPEFTGGNWASSRGRTCRVCCFNEAAGIHRRKLSFRDFYNYIDVLLQ